MIKKECKNRMHISTEAKPLTVLNHSSNPCMWRMCAIPLLLAPRTGDAQSGCVVNFLIFMQKSLCAKFLRGLGVCPA